MATVVYKLITTLLSILGSFMYNTTLHWLKCKLTFSLLCSAITDGDVQNSMHLLPIYNVILLIDHVRYLYQYQTFGMRYQYSL